MNKTVKSILIFIVASIAGYYFTVFITPYYILLKIKFNSGSTMNVPVYSDVMTDKDRHVVMPNPDFLYVATGYNIRNRSIRITGKIPDSTYSSIAFYADNTLNYCIMSDRDMPEKEYTIILTKENSGDTLINENEKEKTIISPSGMGTILVRILIHKNENIEKLKEIQHSFKVEEIK